MSVYSDKEKVISESVLTDKMKRSFFQAAVVPILDALHGLNGWRKSLTATTQEFCEQYWTSPRGNTAQSSSYTATCHPSRKLSKLDEPDMQDTAGEAVTSSYGMFSYGPPSHSRAKAGRPARNYIQQLCEDTGCSPEDLPEAINDREEWRVRVRDIHAGGTKRWWWDDDDLVHK